MYKVHINSFGDRCLWNGDKYIGLFKRLDSGEWVACPSANLRVEIPCVNEHDARAILIDYSLKAKEGNNATS